jgi:hypothetical protein
MKYRTSSLLSLTSLKDPILAPVVESYDTAVAASADAGSIHPTASAKKKKVLLGPVRVTTGPPYLDPVERARY